ncbi:hypothetical protein AM593_05767, partial [Mytilus galloprovincialis]
MLTIGQPVPVENIVYQTATQSVDVRPTPVQTSVEVFDYNRSSYIREQNSGPLTGQLYYADVIFPPTSTHDVVNIIGIENRTVYTDVTVSGGATSLVDSRNVTSSDEEEEDFVEIQEREQDSSITFCGIFCPNVKLLIIKYFDKLKKALYLTDLNHGLVEIEKDISILICMHYAGSYGSSIGSDVESSLQCSKYHFEERILEKLVRIEHKLEIYDEKMKTWEKLVPSNLDKIDDAKKKTEFFLESMRDTLNQEHMRLNDSFLETVDQIYIQSESKVKSVLDSVSTKMEKFNEFQQKRENVFDKLQATLQQERTRFNKEKVQLNDSYQETVENIYLQSEKKVKNVLDSFSTKFGEFQNKSENDLKRLQSNLLQNQKQFNQSIYRQMDKVERDSNETNKMIQNFISEQKDIGLCACCFGGRMFDSGTVVKFQTTKASTGNIDLASFQSTGKFTCKVSGFYVISVVIMSITDQAQYEVTLNDDGRRRMTDTKR